MTLEEGTKVLERSFDLLDELIKSCFSGDEAKTRNKLEVEFSKRIKTNKDPLEHAALMDAKQKISSLTWPELEEIYEIISDFEDYEANIPKAFESDPKMRSKILKSEKGDSIQLFDDGGGSHIFYMLSRIAHNSKFYVYLSSMELMKDDGDYEGTFFEYIVGEHSKDDKLVLVEDENLIKELREIA